MHLLFLYNKVHTYYIINMAKIIRGSIKNKVVCSDLQEERDQRDFDNEAGRVFKNLVHPQYQKTIERSGDFISSDPILQNSHKFYDMTREEQWLDHIKKFRRAFELDKNRFVNIDEPNYWSIEMLG